MGWSHPNYITTLTTSFIISTIFFSVPTAACPTNQTLFVFCQCESSYNGILLDCSNRDAGMTLGVLRENQVQLGLIQELTLQNSSLVELPSYFLKGLYVKKLDLSQNSIQQVNQLAFNGLETILQSLNLSSNQLEMVPVVALDGMDALLELDLSKNTIGDLDSKQSLRHVPKVFNLDLANNRICNIQKSAFDAVKNSLQTLNLGENCLTEVPASALRGFKQLLALHLHKNQIAKIDPLAFMNLPMLNRINLAANRIESIHRQAFLNVPNLRLMYLSENNLHELQPGQFRHFEALEMLDLTRNQIHSIPKGAFSNMPRLQQLYLGENRLTSIEHESFANSSLVVLLMPFNLLTSLTPEMFDGLTYLQQLSLKNNMIEHITQNTFYQMPSLVMLDLAGNRIASLQPATFLAQLNMFLIDLSSNQLANTPYNAFNKRIMTVVLQENPLVCTERVHMLQNGVGIFVQESEDRVCGGSLSQPNPNQPQRPGQAGTGLNNNPNPHGFNQPGTGSFRQLTAPPRPQDGGGLNGNSGQPQRPLIRPNPNNQAGAGRFGPVNQRPTQFTTPSGQGLLRTSPRLPVTPQSTIRPVGIPNNFAPHLSVPGDVNPRTPQATHRPPPQNLFNPGFNPAAAAGTANPQPGRPGGVQPPPRQRGGPQTGAQTPGPEIRQPFPVPFLSPNPLSRGFAQPSTTPVPTLPPGIVIATNRPPVQGTLPPWTPPTPRTSPPRTPPPQWGHPAPPQQHRPPHPAGVPPGGQQPGRPWQIPTGANNTRWQQTIPGLPPGVDIPQHATPEPPPPARNDPRLTTIVPRTPPPPKLNKDGTDGNLGAPGFEGADASVDLSGSGRATGSATTTVIVCLTVVVVVMVAVFVTLCVVRHRSHTASRRMASSSSQASSAAAARTSAYVAAQAAYAAQQYGSLVRPGAVAGRPPAGATGAAAANGTLAPSGTLPKPGNSQPGQHTWIYTPGSYSSASNYYK